MATQQIVQSPRSATLADVLDRVLDKGLVVAGDIKIKLLDIELLTIQVRLVVCSVDKAAAMGMDFWRNDPHLSPRLAGTSEPEGLARRVAELEAVVAKLDGGRDT
ncbi:gas vesicle protein GvpJ [Archangium lipolyticum]|uniref:gas vesicle protein GvpJ n=1 Tax=Archangium lipolyticum TaxID=2970465 RepID=UPI00214A6CDD|nr:gas vesicle protein GvpJ [Archangium lipolyticum]